MLYYFESNNAVDPKGSIPLGDCILKSAEDETKRKLTIGIYHDTYVE